MPEYITPEFVAQMTSFIKTNKALLEDVVIPYLDLALRNPVVASQMMNGRYLYAVVVSLLEDGAKEHVELAKGYLKEVSSSIIDTIPSSFINFDILRSDAQKIKKEIKVKDKEIDDLLTKIEKTQKKK